MCKKHVSSFEIPFTECYPYNLFFDGPIFSQSLTSVNFFHEYYHRLMQNWNSARFYFYIALTKEALKENNH